MRRTLKRFVVFASGRGTNLENIIRQIRAGKIKGELALVFSDQRGSGALKISRRYKIDALCLARNEFVSKEDFEKEILTALRERKVDFIVLAGYMKIVGPVLLNAFPRKILNIHPALLPSFRGAHAIQDAYDSGAKVTGVTVHFVDAEVDHGPILLQKKVRVEARDSLKSLEKKIHAAEYEIYPRAIQLFVDGKRRISGRKVMILKSRVPRRRQ